MLALLLILGAACGPSGGPGRVRVRVQWPQAAGLAAQAIPANTVRVRLGVAGPGIGERITATLERIQGQAEAEAELEVPAGRNRRLGAQALDAQERVLASAQVTDLTITPGLNPAVVLELVPEGLVVRPDASPSPSPTPTPAASASPTPSASPTASASPTPSPLPTASPAQTFVVTTLAGSTFGFADGSGTAAMFNSPFGVWVDSAGNVYVSDTGNNRIRKITSGGVVTTLAGSGGATFQDGTGTTAQFKSPQQVVSDDSGNIFVADRGNHRVRLVDPGLVVSTVAGQVQGNQDGIGTAAQLSFPQGVARDNAGDLYISEIGAGSHKIRKISGPNDAVATLAGSGVAGFADGTGAAAQFSSPSSLAVAVAAGGDIFVADTGNHRIRRVTPAGVVTTFAGDGTAGAVNGTGTGARFDSPQGVAVDLNGFVYVADTGNGVIRVITPEGVVKRVAGSGQAGGADGTGTAASFRNPTGIAVDASGSNIYVADNSNHRIRRIARQ